MERLSVALFIFSSLLVVCSSTLLPKTGFNCTAQKTCGACAAESPQCHWCSAPDYSRDRCNHLSVLNQNNCSQEHIVSPKNVKEDIKNEPPRSGQSGSPAVQLAPQEIRIKLRPNEPFQFQMNFRQAENYPVDIYFIMDASNSMKQYKEMLAKFSHLLVSKIGNITTDFRLGFGTFVDKTTLPFVATIANNEAAVPCGNCSNPYGFKNELRLTTNDSDFKRLVAGLNTSGNLDTPEGGFDALMQALACTNEIGWRDQSRKMILFSTDGSFHYAGDGKLGGIVIPNDGNCHLTWDGYYSESLNQDYPSISQLAQKIADKKVNVIFMVHENQAALYTELSKHILGSNVSTLAKDFSNVIDLVQENYERIRSAVELKTKDLTDVQIAFSVKCPSDVTARTNPHCDGLQIGQSVSFNVTLNVDSCPSNRKEWIKTFEIYPVGLSEKLTVHLDLICECPCELQGAGEANSAKCNANGTYGCGICKCNQGFKGKECECRSSSDDDRHDDMPCRMTNTSDVCQGKGQCECGQCACYPINRADPAKRYTGLFCQCSNYNCDYSKGEICGGPSRGVCNCGKCECHANYTGDACDCLLSQASCMDSNGGICNDKGSCQCGVCECRDVFKGPTCQDCPTCPGKCEENRECVKCRVNKQEDQCSSVCLDKTIAVVDNINEMSDWRDCSFRDDDQCEVLFIYNYKTNEVKALRTKVVCTLPTSNLVIILSVIGGVIAIGIISLLVWKVVVTVHDQREYKAFVEEQATARWDVAQNPVYKPATTNFQNPTYRPGSTINH